MARSDIGLMVELIEGYLSGKSEPLAINVLSILVYASTHSLEEFMRSATQDKELAIVQTHVIEIVAMMASYSRPLISPALSVCLYRRIKNLSAVLALELS